MQYLLLHEDYLLYVLPRILESKKMEKSGSKKQKEADLEYSVAKQVEKMIRYNLKFLLTYFSSIPKSKCRRPKLKKTKTCYG